MPVSVSVRVVAEWYPLGGVISLEFHAVLRRTYVGAVWHSTYPSGDKVAFEKRTDKFITGCTHEGGCGI